MKSILVCEMNFILCEMVVYTHYFAVLLSGEMVVYTHYLAVLLSVVLDLTKLHTNTVRKSKISPLAADEMNDKFHVLGFYHMI